MNSQVNLDQLDAMMRNIDGRTILRGHFRAALHDAYPAMAAELRALRERIKVLEQEAAKLSKGGAIEGAITKDSRDYQKRLEKYITRIRELEADLAAAREHLGIAINNAAGWRKRTAERRQKMKELAAHVERLREALNRAITALVFADTPESKAFHFHDLVDQLRNTLSSTHAQSLAAHDAALLRKVAAKIRKDEELNAAYYAYILEANADRIEKGAAMILGVNEK